MSELLGSPLSHSQFSPYESAAHLVSSPLLTSLAASDAGTGTPLGLDDVLHKKFSGFDSRHDFGTSPNLRIAESPLHILPSAWSEAQESSDPLTSVQQHLLETKITASMMNRRDKQRTRDERRRRKMEESSDRVQDLARNMEVDKSKIAKQAFDHMMHASKEAEETRREKWRLHEEDRKRFEEEHEELRDLYHKREVERQKELTEEKERFVETYHTLDKKRQEELDRERKFYKERDKHQLERFEELQKKAITEVQGLRSEFQLERNERLDITRRLDDTNRLLEDKLDHVGANATDASSHRENLLLSSENASLKQDKVLHLRQLDEARDEAKKNLKAKDKDLDHARDELAAERRSSKVIQERLEREKRTLEETLHQKQRDADMREWKLLQDYETEKRAKETAEDDRHREVQQLRKDLDGTREQVQQSAGRNNDGKDDLIKERDKLAHNLKQLQNELSAEKDKSHREILDLQKSISTLRESTTVTTSKLQLDKERIDTLQEELDSAKKERKDLEDYKRTQIEESTITKFELQRAKDEKATLERSVTTLETKVREQKNVIDAKEGIIKDKELQQASLNSQVKNVEVSVHDKEQHFKKKEDELRREAEEAAGNARRLTTELDASKAKVVEEQGRTARLQEQHTRLEHDHDQLKTDQRTKETDLADLRTKVRQKDSEMQTLLDIHKQEVQDLKSQHERETRDKVGNVTHKNSAITQELDSLRAELVESKAKLERAKEKQAASLQNEIEQLSDTERRLQTDLDEQTRKLTLMKADLAKEKSEAHAASCDIKLLQCELRESRQRSDTRESEKTDMSSIYDMFITGLHRCFRDDKNRDKQQSFSSQDEIDRLRTQLDREKEETRTLTKDLQEAQYKARNAQEDKTLDDRARKLRNDLDKETTSRMDTERDLRNLRREVDDAQATARRQQEQLTQADKLRRDLQEEVDHLRSRGGAPAPAAAAAAAPSRSSFSQPPPEAPQHLIIRACAALCEDRAEARTIEQSNGVYTLVPGGLSEALKDSRNSRASWPLSNCCWERKLPTQRWLYSSAQGAWKLTDGVRSNGVFDLASEVDDGSSFQALVQPRTPHNGVMPHAFSKWCKGVTVEPPPPELSVTADKTSSTGTYKLTTRDLLHGWPVWAMDSPKRYLYNTQEGAWQITDHEREFTRGGGLVVDAKHNGVLPHVVPWDSGVTVSLVCDLGVGDWGVTAFFFWRSILLKKRIEKEMTVWKMTLFPFPSKA